MKSFLALAVLLAAGCLVATAQPFDEAAFDDPVLDERYRSLIHEVRCPQCQNESIADSNAQVAADLRRAIHEQMIAGASDAEIVEFLLARYGDFVLYRPRVTATTWPLWAGPFVFLALGGLVFARIVRRRLTQPLEADGDA